MTAPCPEVARMAGYVATLARGPGRSRALTRGEAADAMALLLDGAAAPEQVGALLMLLRYRGEDPDEIAGLVEGAAPRTRVAAAVALDWPSYGAGRSRGAPWFLLAALALADSGWRILMHGTNDFTAGQSVAAGLAELGRAPAEGSGDVARLLDAQGFAYLPLAALCPPLAHLLGLRALLGLRSPLNTVARLLDPADAAASLAGVFHPPYIETHLAAAERLGRPRMLVLKGGGGEAERPPAKATTVHLWREGAGRTELLLPATGPAGERSADTPALLAAVWQGEAAPEAAVATVVGTIAMALLALGRAGGVEEADAMAGEVWRGRL